MTEYFTKEEVRELLKKQREICAYVIVGEELWHNFNNVVKNTPEPELKGIEAKYMNVYKDQVGLHISDTEHDSLADAKESMGEFDLPYFIETVVILRPKTLTELKEGK